MPDVGNDQAVAGMERGIGGVGGGQAGSRVKQAQQDGNQNGRFRGRFYVILE